MILVTGGTGFVGSYLLYYLMKGDEKVRAIYRCEKKVERVEKIFSFLADDEKLFGKIEWFKADITDLPTMNAAFVGVTKVYHCAGLISFDSKDYREMRRININGTMLIVNLCIDAKIEKLCFVSSIACLGTALKENLITEESEWNNQADNSEYSITKFGAEMEVWRAAQEGVKVVIVNPGVILGGGFWDTGSGKFFTQIFNGFKYYTEGVTGFVGVKDVVKAMILLMNSKIKNERFIIVSENKSFKEIFFLIADAFGKTRPSKKVKPWQITIFWKVSWLLSMIGVKPRLSKYTAKSAFTISIYWSKKIEKTLHFKFQPIEEVVQETCKEYITTGGKTS